MKVPYWQQSSPTHRGRFFGRRGGLRMTDLSDGLFALPATVAGRVADALLVSRYGTPITVGCPIPHSSNGQNKNTGSFGRLRMTTVAGVR